MARRKRLLGINTLNKGNELLDMGVPMTKVHKQLELEGQWTYQSTVDVFTADRNGLHSVTRPPWLEDEPILQETPVGWKFVGLFPEGTWVKQQD